MAKWADYCVSKLSLNDQGFIDSVIICPDLGDTLGDAVEKSRSWMVRQVNAEKTFCTIKKNTLGGWNKIDLMSYSGSIFSWYGPIPENLPNRKTFVSYYHNDDEDKRTDFDKLFDDLITSKSVKDGDIDSDNSDGYIKKLIQQGYLNDTTVLVVLVGAKTKCRKHVDWEISGALDHKVGDKYSGVLGLLLPTHPDFGSANYQPNQLPKRLAANVESGYAILRDWTEDRQELQQYIEAAIANRSNNGDIVNRTIPQMKINTCS